MSNYDNAYGLMHYGVKGMKWGVRKNRATQAQPTTKRQRAITRATRGIDKDIQSFKPYAKTGMRAKNGRLEVSSAEVKATIEALEKLKDKKISKINAWFDKRVNASNRDIQSFKQYVETGMRTKNGNVLVTREEVSAIIAALEDERNKYV